MSSILGTYTLSTARLSPILRRWERRKKFWCGRSSQPLPSTSDSSGFSTEFDQTTYSPTAPSFRSTVLDLARIHNCIPSMLLVLFGAWKATYHTWSVFADARVWVMSLVAAGVAVGSVIANDYFDYLTGVDDINSPDKPIPSGLIRADIALLISHFIYVFVLVAGCVMEPPMLRWIIAFSATSTLLYTSILKPLTLVKNFLVATVIALSPISGALAAGAGDAGVESLKYITGFVFGSVVFREILMDISDVEGDRSARIFTLPVVLGKTMALCIAVLALSLGCISGLWSLWKGSAAKLLSHQFPNSVANAIVLGVFGLNASPMFVSSATTLFNSFDRLYLKQFIDRMLVPLALNFLFLVAFS